ncbi:protein-L-isoaspartate O-methyltransferase family protein [Brucellaceae bacterium C25G]
MSADFENLRTKMVDNQIRTTDVTNLALLDAFLAVPREAFVPENRKELAYIDEDILLDSEATRYLMEPSPLAKLIQLAEVKSSDLVLDVGCGSGYACAILSQLAGSVVGLENDSALAANASATLERLGYDNVVIVSGELNHGHSAQAPYDIILIEGAVDYIPQSLKDQLKDGGKLIAVEGRGNLGVARIYTKENSAISCRDAFNLSVKSLHEFAHKAEFAF